MIKKIKKFLRRGDMSAIALEFSVSRAFVYAVLAGERKNDDILKRAAELAAIRKAESQKLKETLKSL